jgi:hypothetical protein
VENINLAFRIAACLVVLERSAEKRETDLFALMLLTGSAVLVHDITDLKFTHGT